MIKNNQTLYINFLITVIAAFLFIPFLGQVHLFDWDEINFAESAREMILSGDYLNVQINFKPFYEKPPLFIWMQVLSMKIFGINEFAARFPNAICGIITLLVIFNIGKNLINNKFGIFWVMTFAGSLLPFFYFKSGIIDPWFNLFIFSGIYFLFKYFEYDLNKRWHITLSAFFIGLAVLTKGPVGFLIFGLTGFIFLIFNRFQYKIRLSDVLIFCIIFIITGGFWFLLQIISGNYGIIQDFISYQIYLFQSKGAGHGGFFLYHFVVLLIGVFPAAVFMLKSFKKNSFPLEIQNQFKLLMSILFWTVLILFTIVKTKILHYSSMCYFPLTFLASTVIYRVVEQKERLNRWIIILISIFTIIYSLIISLLPVMERNKQQIIDAGIINDQFAIANFMANAGWTGYEFLIGAVILIATLLFIFFWRSGQVQSSIISLFVGSTLFIYLSIIYITPKIEKYSQYAAIEFLKTLKSKDCYITTIEIKSYAQYFYAEIKIPENEKAYDNEWLLKGDTDKDVYLMIRNKMLKYVENKYKGFTIVYEKNGYIFLLKKKTQSND